MAGLGEHVITWFVDEGRIEDFSPLLHFVNQIRAVHVLLYLAPLLMR